MSIVPTDLEKKQLLRDKYADIPSSAYETDLARLASGEPLAYVIGWMPFLGLRIRLDSKPLIPRPETEWWAEELLKRIEERHGDNPFHLLDLCAGSGAIGLAVLARFPTARVSFGELDPAHVALIRENIRENGLDESRADVRSGDLFVPFAGERFDVIATNPPYIPSTRTLDASVLDHEPAIALFSEEDGLGLIRRIATESAQHLLPKGELWMECDESNAAIAAELVSAGGASSADMRTDQYGRPRIVMGYYP